MNAVFKVDELFQFSVIPVESYVSLEAWDTYINTSEYI